jgi:hypothetical protein
MGGLLLSIPVKLVSGNGYGLSTGDRDIGSS